MRLLHFQEPPPPLLGEALERFEHQFTYPLGAEGRFRISHGPPYLPFFEAMGRASLWIAEQEGQILGTLVSVPRLLQFSGTSEGSLPAHYLCDLKVSPKARHGRVLALLMTGAKQSIEASGIRSCYSIVMQGTARSPDTYTGRLGIPRFEVLGSIEVLRVSRPANEPGRATVTFHKAFPQGPACRVTGGCSQRRSLMAACPIGIPGESAGGILEDTRKAKRLWVDGAGEMLTAHLSGFHFEDPQAGAGVIRRALDHAEAAGLGGVFVSVPGSQGPALADALSGLLVDPAPAAVFGCGLPGTADWWVDTAEI